MYDCQKLGSGNKRASVTVSYVDDGNKSWTDDWATKAKCKLSSREHENYGRGQMLGSMNKLREYGTCKIGRINDAKGGRTSLENKSRERWRRGSM